MKIYLLFIHLMCVKEVGNSGTISVNYSNRDLCEYTLRDSGHSRVLKKCSVTLKEFAPEK